MLTDTQISSFLIPKDVWENGVRTHADLPPLAIPARDALDIERRASKAINLHNEEKRYTLCCERMQGIVQELSHGTSALPSPMVWPAHRFAHNTTPSARAYLGLIEAICRTPRLGQKAIDARMAAVFLVPEDTKICLAVFEALRILPTLNDLFERAARIASPPGSPFKVTGAQCSRAFTQRYELVKRAWSEMYAIVDAVELV